MSNSIRQVYILALMVLLPVGGMVGRAGTVRKSVPAKVKQAALRAAIKDLITTFGKDYPGGKGYLTELDDIEHRMNETIQADRAKMEAELIDLQRRALTTNPLVSGQPVLFIVRRQYKKDHHNTATMFKTGEINTNSFHGGGALKTIDLAKVGEIRTLIESAEGIVRDPEIHFDGEKIIFSMRRNISDDYHIYEINADGTGLRQLTSAPGVADFDPVYTPDDDIVFSSTREPKYCMCNRHIMGNLFRMDADGANIHQIGKSTLHEGHSALMPE